MADETNFYCQNSVILFVVIYIRKAFYFKNFLA